MTEDQYLHSLRSAHTAASRLGLMRLVCAFFIVIPPIVSLFDAQQAYVYLLSGLSLIFVVGWAAINHVYNSARHRSLSARRALMISNGTGEPIHATLRENLRELFENDSGAANFPKVSSYYSSQLPPGPRRVIELVEECSFYSERTHAHSGKFLFVAVNLYVFSFIAAILVAIPSFGSDTIELLARFFMVATAFFLSTDLYQRAIQHNLAAKECKRIQRQCLSLLQDTPSTFDSMLLLADYFSAMESAPETLPMSYSPKMKSSLDSAWQVRKA